MQDIVRWCRTKEIKELRSFIPAFSMYARELDNIVDFMEALEVISKEEAIREKGLIKDMFWKQRPLEEILAFRRDQNGRY